MKLNSEIDKYRKFEVFSLVDNTISDFDIYIHIRDHFILYSPPGYRWIREELNSLIKKGYESFYVRNSENPKVNMYLSLSKLPSIEKSLAPKQRIQSIQDVGASFIKCLHEGEVTASSVVKGRNLADSIINCLQEDLSCIQHLSGLADRDFYTYFHSIRVSMYATAIAIQMGLTDQSILTDIALGGIFHDIGKKILPEGIINKTGPLNTDEWTAMRKHPETGLSLIENSLLSHVPREIIIHHHEKLNGSGYPHGLTQDSLLQEVQIATLADVFDALTSSRSYQNKRSRFEALDLIKNKFLQADISKEAFKGLVQALVQN